MRERGRAGRGDSAPGISPAWHEREAARLLTMDAFPAPSVIEIAKAHTEIAKSLRMRDLGAALLKIDGTLELWRRRP